jgi:hypothetical protein
VKTNSALQRDVLDELAWEPSVDAGEIGVSVENGVVILNGTVKSLCEKWTAERAAQRVDGVRAVTDEILPGRRSMPWIGMLPYRATGSSCSSPTGGLRWKEAWNTASRGM